MLVIGLSCCFYSSCLPRGFFSAGFFCLGEGLTTSSNEGPFGLEAASFALFFLTGIYSSLDSTAAPPLSPRYPRPRPLPLSPLPLLG